MVEGQAGKGQRPDGNGIIDDFLLEGLEGLRHMSDGVARDSCASYVKRQNGAIPIVLTPIQRQRMKVLVL